MFEVTIAIPVHNVEQYIRKAMDSALSQTFQSIEFLVIDDKGNDNSMEIVRSLQKEHSRGNQIRIVDNIKNKGLSETRNVALKEATGKYLFFLDSDDYMSEDCIELLYNAIEKEKAQIAIASCQEVLLDGSIRKTYQLPYTHSQEPNELASLRYGKLYKDMICSAWNTLYLMSFLRENNVRYKARRICEDALFWFDVFPLVTSFVLLPNITYFYVIRDGSLSFFNSVRKIPLSEVQERIDIRTYGKNTLNDLKDKPYFSDMSSVLMHDSLIAAISIIKNRKSIEPKISLSDIKNISHFPCSLKTVLCAKSRKFELLAYYIFSHLPGCIEYLILIILNKQYSKKKH